jgi:hypothetical protein
MKAFHAALAYNNSYNPFHSDVYVRVEADRKAVLNGFFQRHEG